MGDNAGTHYLERSGNSLAVVLHASLLVGQGNPSQYIIVGLPPAFPSVSFFHQPHPMECLLPFLYLTSLYALPRTLFVERFW